MKKLITIAAMATTLLALNAGLTTANENTNDVGGADTPTTRLETNLDTERPANADATPAPTILWTPADTTFRLDPGSIAGAVQPAQDPGYDAWRAEIDAARAGRRLAMVVAAGGFAGGFLGYSMLNPAFDPSNPSSFETGGDTAATLVMIAGWSAGGIGILQWITRNRQIGELNREGERAGYVSVMPVRGGAVGTLALSF